MVFSCKDCPNREVGCHATCEKYNKEADEWRKINKQMHSDNDYIGSQERFKKICRKVDWK